MRTKVVPLQAAALLAVAFVLTACSGGEPAGPRAGTPAWYWQAAQETFDAADYVKAQEHLGEITGDENEWRKRAAVWRIVVLSGLSRSYLELSDAYSKGAEASPAKSAAFQNPIQQYQRDARQYAIELAESLPKYQKFWAADATIPFDFSFPAGSPNESPQLSRIEDGEVPTEVQQSETERQEVNRGVLLQAALLAGSGDDINTARGKFGGGPVEVPKDAFLNGLGRTMWIVSELFDRAHLNQPDIEKILVTQAHKAIETTIESADEDVKKDAEALKKDIEEKQKLDEEVRKRLRG
ncbi:MAG: hypothetical protein O2968_11010 [Acidobacteria bacterium]|nr:hypothetical protein [Acidobacteriota bacterium]